MKNIRLVAEDLKDLCIRRCDTIFYVSIALAGLATATADFRNGEFSNSVYGSLLDAVNYREMLRLILWIEQNPKYATAALYGVYAGAMASVLLRHPGSFLYEACVYLVLRTAATMLFDLNEKKVFKLYVDVLFDYYNRSPPPRKPRSGAGFKRVADRLAPVGAWAASLAPLAYVQVKAAFVARSAKTVA